MYFLINMIMAKQVINIGALANDGTGDTLRAAFDKVNDNFSEAYLFDVNQLSDVDTSANGGLANGKVLAYDSSSGKFEPSSLVYASNLTDLADVTISSAAAGNVIRHNGTAWVDATLSTLDVTENTNLYYTDARADARVTLQINALVDSAPNSLNTLNELAAALGDDANYGATITTALAGKEPTITAGSTAQYWRGDKSFQSLDTSNVTENTNLYYTNVRADARIAAANIGDLNNVNTAGVGANKALKYNSGTSVFEVVDYTLAALTDVTITSAASGDILKHNGSAWVDVVLDSSIVPENTNLYHTSVRADARADVRIAASSVNALNDVTITSVANNQLLQYNSGSSQWVNVAQALGGGGVSVTTESFTGNSVSTAFTLTTTGVSTNNLIVSVNGVVQRPVGAYSVSGQTLTFTAAPPTGTDNIEVRCLATGEPGFLVITASQAVVTAGRYAVDTVGGVVTCTLPGSPAAGDAIYFVDAGGAYATNNLTIARNGNTINGVASNHVISTNGQSTGFVYNGATWRTY
jgi:hypothetical protein